MVDPLLRSVIALEKLDYSDAAVVGRQLRGEVREFLASAVSAEDLLAFFDEFESGETAAAALAATIRGYLVWGVERVLEGTAESEHDAGVAAEWIEMNAGVLMETAELRERLAEGASTPPSLEELIGTVLGERPRLRTQHPNELRVAFGTDVRRHAQLAARQLRLLVDSASIPPEAATTWLTLATRIGTEAFPLLAHRTALLTWRLLHRAVAVDARGAARLLVGFYGTQTARIVSAGRRADEELTRYRSGDDHALVEAYRTLAEGILRPFGGLIVHVQALAAGRGPAQLAVRPLLGGLEDALHGASSELAELVAFGIARPLRNAGAHLDVVRNRAGQLCIAEEDGQLLEIDMHALDRDYSLLRSALTGVDIACGLAYWLLVPGHEHQALPASATTDAVLEQLATFAVADVTPGFVTRFIVDGDRITFTLHADVTAPQILAIIALLDPHLDVGTRTVIVLNPEGEVLTEYQRTPEATR